MFRRQRVTIQDVAVFLGIVLLIGLAAYQYSFTGSSDGDKRIEFEEALVLAGVIVVPIVYLGWRRISDLQRELSRRIAAERRAHELAHTDPLTGLANRREFDMMLKAAIDLPRGASEIHAVMMLDPNGFKKINELYGQAEGDDLLAAIAERLRPVVRERDLVARLGDNAFAIIARFLSGPEGAGNIAARLMKAMEAPIQIGSRKHKLSVAIGIALIPNDGAAPDELLRKADIALDRARNEAASAVCFVAEDMDLRLRDREAIARELALAIGTDALRPWYQPIVDLATGDIVAFEALARWRHPTRGDIAPDRFIPVAESAGLIRDLSDWLLRCAAQDAQSWPERVRLSFNISPAQLQDRTLGLHILRILGGGGLSPKRLMIELSESAIVHDLEAAKEILSPLREAGIVIVVDNFGTGNSSLYHLRNFKPDKIKIDRSLVHAMGSDAESAGIVKALAGLGNGLGLTVAAAGIEANSERDALVRAGCRQGQGFLFSRTVPATETSSLLAPGGKHSKPGQRLA